MKFSVSNIALTAYDHSSELGYLPELGFSGLEVAPSRIWRDTWRGLTATEVTDYRRQVEKAGLSVVGLHSLFYDHPDLGLFKTPEKRAESMNFLEHLSEVCRDLGGRTLIYGGGRKRGDRPKDEARAEALDFFGELCTHIEGHGTCFCFEPLGPNDTDFINSAMESLSIVHDVASPALRVQLDAKALVKNAEANIDTFRAVAPMLVHYHANEPGLGVIGTSGQVDHAALGALLREINYDGYVSVEQRLLNDADPLTDVAKSANQLKVCYQ